MKIDGVEYILVRGDACGDCVGSDVINGLCNKFHGTCMEEENRGKVWKAID